MRTVVLVLYLTMGVWLLVAAAIRVALQLAAGVSLDALPFVSGGIALVALLALIPTYDDWRGRRERPERVPPVRSDEDL